MATTVVPQPPSPPPANVQRFDASGKPTPAQVIYEQAVFQFLKALKAAVEGS